MTDTQTTIIVTAVVTGLPVIIAAVVAGIIAIRNDIRSNDKKTDAVVLELGEVKKTFVADIKEVKDVIVEVKGSVAEVTNGMKDELIKATDAASRAEGKEEGRKEEQARAAATAAPTEVTIVQSPDDPVPTTDHPKKAKSHE